MGWKKLVALLGLVSVVGGARALWFMCWLLCPVS